VSAHVTVCTTIAALPDEVWADIEDIATHPEWMTDADQLRFRGDQRTGVGTEFTCRTRVGPLAVTDVLEVTEWEPEAVMGILHRGAVTGTGRFTLRPAIGGGTRFCWREDLRFPWWLGGALGARVAVPIFRRIWSANLRRLKERLER